MFSIGIVYMDYIPPTLQVILSSRYDFKSQVEIKERKPAIGNVGFVRDVRAGLSGMRTLVRTLVRKCGICKRCQRFRAGGLGFQILALNHSGLEPGTYRRVMHDGL